MRLSRWIFRGVLVSVVFVVDVQVSVMQRFVSVLVFVPFGQMEPDPQSHERRAVPSDRRASTKKVGLIP